MFGFEINVNGILPSVGTGVDPIFSAISIIVDTITDIIPDAEFVAPVHGGYAILLWCETQVLDIIYELSHGAVNTVQATLSSNITTCPLSGPLAIQVLPISYPLWLAAQINAMSGNSTRFSN
jgi:hypothetical protein